jgi:hypothetical protein
MQACTSPTQQQIKRMTQTRLALPHPRDAWATILPGLEKLAGMYPDNDWTIEGVRRMLDEDEAVLLVDQSDPSAFAIVKFREYPYSDGETELFVYLVWHQGGEAIARFQSHLEMFAHHGGARYMRFYSRRRAFLRVAERAGYCPHSVEYVKEIPHVRW